MISGINLAPPPPPPELAILVSTLCYIGCSNTDRHWWGYSTLHGNSSRRAVVGSGTNTPYGTGAGSLLRWGVARSNGQYRGHREIFENWWNPGYPIHIQWCIRSSETSTMGIAESQINNFASWLLSGDGQSEFTGVDDVPVWVSPLNRYAPGDDPSQVQNAAFHDEAVEYTIDLLSEDLTHVNLGPITGPITTAQTTDGTHPDAAARLILGAQLFDFFDPFVVTSLAPAEWSETASGLSVPDAAAVMLQWGEAATEADEHPFQADDWAFAWAALNPAERLLAAATAYERVGSTRLILDAVSLDQSAHAATIQADLDAAVAVLVGAT